MYYVEMNKCGSCRYYTYEGENTKGYCSWHKSYYFADDSCSHWEEGNVSSSGGCFLTTACCKHKGLPDDCKELTALRYLRDNYMKKYDFGQALVDIYYNKAPGIVDKINAMNNHSEIYEGIYNKIQEIVIMIKNEKFDEAVGAYVKLMFWVEKL